MKLSILDQSPIANGQTAKEALKESLKLALEAERLGYTRYWIAEHHDLPGLACSAPEVMLGYIGGQTNTIKLGSGAVLLPHYKPYKVAEIYNMLATLFPGRIDVGIGRAPGGSAEATEALSGNFLEKVWKFPDLIEELLLFLQDDFRTDNKYSKLSASPVPPVQPEPWLLGTSEKSALLAAEKGIGYNFGQFMSERDGKPIIKKYREGFSKRHTGLTSKVIMTISAVCAETTEKAHEIALLQLVSGVLREKETDKKGLHLLEDLSDYTLSEQEEQEIEQKKKHMVIGNPNEVKKQLLDIREVYDADEIMINTNIHRQEDRFRSYRLIAEELLSPNFS